MRKQRAADISDIALPRRAQSRMVQSAGRSSKSASHLLLHQKLLPPGPPRSAVGSNGNAKTSQFCISSSSMGIRKLPSKILLISKGRFGKRPPSFTTEYIGPAIDSEDSGFGCDFHSSESQPSWCTTDDSTNKSSSVQQPIFSLSSRTLSSSNLSISSQISTSSSASSSPTSVTSFTVPQFSTSSPEKQFLANLLHESLAQEDAIDQFDGPYYTIANSTGAPTSTSTTPPLSDPVPVPVSTSSSSSPQRIAQESINQAGKVLLIVPSTTSNNSQPLNFTQVFGKLSPTEIVNNTLLSQYLNGSAAGAISNVSTQQPKQEQQQQFGYDSTVIKIEQELNTNSTMKLPPELINNEESSSFRVVNPTSINDNFSKPLSPPVVNNSNIVSPIQSHCSLNTLKDILIESSREAVELDDSVRENERKQNSSEGDQAAAVVAEVARYDPMVILSQAVTLQKELYEEPALDGIPINGKRANISGFGFAKGINTTASTNTTLNGLIVDSLPTSSLPASTLVSVVPQQTQQVLDSQQPLKLMQLTENVRMSPDSTQTGVTVSSSTLPFSSHQVTRQITTSTPVITQMGTNPTSPTSTTSNPSPSPIPVKRSRFSFAHPAASKISGLKLRNQNQNQNYMPARSVGKRLPPGTTPTLTSNLAPYTRDGRAQLQIVSQPEEQHRARYQTEGSRGAIKDRKGNGFPTVKLVGYDKPATLQIFIGSDQGKISPHMFYQACKVTGKSSTPCIEKKVEGTILIEIEFEPSKEMVISCDCVGILKERNVDVEQRFPFHHASQSRKKSTKCRMIYRTTVINSDGMEETLQVASLPILCTQPPGVPEICKQSLTECPARGGLELFVVGKNFLKDTRVVFQQEDTEGNAVWETSSEPLKDYLQQNHLICPVPAFKEEKIVEPVECKVLVVSGGKHSEPHRFTYLPELVNGKTKFIPILPRKLVRILAWGNGRPIFYVDKKVIYILISSLVYSTFHFLLLYVCRAIYIV
ncbi:unnamed protein product [Orchesella dallaii]|uniref:RHD domain-containing protein n=1 Tax=Orchesella dallaii TaxID=48710 RepID=A0ABP1RNA8_9HEXA